MEQTVQKSHGSVVAESLPPLGGKCGIAVAKHLAPKPADARYMLRAIRERRHWSQAQLAAMLCVSKSCVVKWESGERKPNGTASRLISMLHFDRGEAVKKALDLVNSGRPYAEPAPADATVVSVQEVVNPTSFGIPDSAQSSEGNLSVQRARVAVTQQYVFSLIGIIHQTITDLPDNRQKLKHLREMSSLVAQCGKGENALAAFLIYCGCAPTPQV
jgi:DNA-binding XRE family transcriptional regulator